MPKVAIIYLLHNGRQYIADCFRSLETMAYPREDAEIVVIDNASSDDGLDFFKKEILPKSGATLPKITLIESKENKGFAEGNNIGIRLALEKNFDYVYLLNQDTEADPDFLAEAIKEAEKNKKAGSVQSCIFLYPEKVRLNSFGNAVHFLGFGYSRGYQLLLADAEGEIAAELGRNHVFEMAYASGAGVLYRATALRETGLLDSEFFLYHEDLDLGWRLRLAGWDNILAPSSRIYHKYDFSRSIKKYYWMERNRFLVLFKLYKIPTLILLAPALLALELGLLFFSLKSGWIKEKWRTYAYFWRLENWKKILRSRRAAQATRKRPDCEIIALFTPKIEFQDFKNPFLIYVANPLMTLYWFIVRAFIFW